MNLPEEHAFMRAFIVLEQNEYQIEMNSILLASQNGTRFNVVQGRLICRTLRMYGPKHENT